MPPKAKYYIQKFRDAWLKDPKLKEWLIILESTQGRIAKCKVCGNRLTNRYADLKEHALSKKHEENSKIMFGKTQLRIPFKTDTEIIKQKQAEAQLALYIACHCSINSADHLGTVCKKSFKGHTAADAFHMHRTKCTNVIRNVMAPHFVNSLRSDIGESPFSLLLDESTDITVKKYLGIIIIYYSELQNKIIETFLDMPELTSVDANGIVSAVKHTLEKHKLKLEKLKGIGTDNAAVMVGINNGVYKKLKEDVPNLILIRCLCHSLQLAVSSAAAENLPRSIDFLIKETYDWFARSSLRQEEYKLVFQAINDGHDPQKLVQACQTRWLSVESAVSKIIDQWLELKTFFGMVRNKERCYTAETLFAIYSDDKNYAFMSLLKNVLGEVQRVNKLFESKNADPTKLLSELINLVNILVAKVKLPHAKIDVFRDHIENYIDNKCYLGYSFENTLKKMQENHSISLAEETELRQRSINFIVSLIKEIKQRLPSNFDILKKISTISVSSALSHNKESLVPLLQYFSKSEKDINLIETQWRKIHLLEWIETKNTKNFWYEVAVFKDANEENPFKNVYTFALELLILPHSNAEVERLFSQLNLIKSKIRNRLNYETLLSLIYTRLGLKRVQKCCDSYAIPDVVTKKIKTKETYESHDLVPDNIEVDLAENIFM